MSQATTVTLYTAADSPKTGAQVQARKQDIFNAIISSHSHASARPSYAVAGTIWKNTTTGQVFEFDGISDIPLMRMVSVPATAADTGAPGSMAADASYLYICTATDTWLRVAIATW